MDPPLRVFVAIATPEPVRHELQRVQRELAPLAPPGVIRWIMPEQFHLTLKFLGNVPAERAAALKETLRPACSEHPALRLRAQGVGFFPNAASPRVIWAGVNDSAGQLLRFQGRIEAALRDFSGDPGGNPFAGHLTLGRFKRFSPRQIAAFMARAQAMNNRPFGEWTADAVELVRSELSPAGARHALLARFALGQ